MRRLSVALDARKLRFACDSPLEGAGFEPSVSLLDDVLRTPVVRVDVGD